MYNAKWVGPMKKITNFLTMSVAVAAMMTSSAFAFDHNRAINLAGKQRMLTQKMSKEAFLIANGVNTEENLENLQKTRDLFDQTLKGLKDGDSELGLDKTEKGKIRKQLDKVAGLWKDFDASVSNIVSSGKATEADVAAIASANIPLLKEMNKGVKFYEADAAGSGTNPLLAKSINLAGRQRMLTQKMSKEFMLVGAGHNVEKNKADLVKTIALFDRTLNGLIDGDANQGLAGAPSPEIKGQLEKVKGMWSEFRKNVEAEPNAETKAAVASQNLPLLKEMNKAVGMYADL